MCKAASGDTVTAIMPGILTVHIVVAWLPTLCSAAPAMQGAVFVSAHANLHDSVFKPGVVCIVLSCNARH